MPSRRLGVGDAGILIGPVFEPLLPRLARVSVSPDRKLWTLDLHDLPSHDGKRLTSNDVRYSIERARRRGGPFATDLRDVVAIELLGANRVRLRLRRANGYIQRVLEELPVARGGGRWGTGPYRLGALEDGVLVLEPFDGYTPEASRVPIELVHEPDSSRALARVQIGDIDVARDYRKSGGDLENSAALELSPPRFRYLAFNARRTLFADPEVRRAASLVIERRALATDGHRGMAQARQLPIWPGGPVLGPAAPVRRPDTRAADELLDRAGWTRRRADGARERDKQKLIAVAVTGLKEDRGAELAFDQLRSSGFVLDVRRLEDKELARALSRGAFDVAVLEWNGFSDWDLSPLLESRGKSNVGNVESSALDEALAALRSSSGSAARGKHVAQLAAAMEDVVPIVTLVQPTTRYMLGERVRLRTRDDADATTQLDLLDLERVTTPSPIE